MTDGSPTPSTSAGPSAIPAAHGLPSFVIPAAPGSGGVNEQFGMSTFTSTPINVGSLAPLLGISPTATGIEVVQAFAAASPQIQAQVQQMLYLGGFYGSNKPLQGVVGKDDLNAIGQAILVSGTMQQGQLARLSSQGVTGDQALARTTPFGDLLSQQANAGMVSGLSSALASRQIQVQTISHPDPNATGDVIDQAYVNALGRKPSDQEKQAFVAAFDASYSGAQRTSIKAQAAASGMVAQDNQTVASTAFGPDPTQSQLPNPLEKPGSAGFRQDQAQGASPAAAKTDRGTPTTVGVDDFARALAGIESGGNSTAQNVDTGAYGTFQILPSNWPSWSAQAGLGGAQPTAANQALVAKFKMQQYYNSLGHSWAAVAVAWYAGPGTALAYLKDPSSPAWSAPQRSGSHTYASIQGYVNGVLARLPGGKDALPQTGGDGSIASEFGGLPTPGNYDPLTVDVTQPDVTADAKAAAIAAHPALAGAHDVTGTFSNFLNIINSSMGA